MTLAPLAILVPMLAAAALVAFGRHVPRPLADGVALLAALATGALCAVLLGRVWHGAQVAWMGGWHPRQGGVVLGIDLAVEPIGASAATFAAVLVAASLLYGQRYFDGVAPMFQALLLVLLAGVVGLCLSGDLFDMFVFFELMSVPAYALTAYRVEDRGPIQGALGFALTNSIGSFLMVNGIGLLYGRTGTLNLAQLGQALAGHRADGLVVAAFALIACGFLVKAAAVPFHFWLPDAYAVAPVPVCIIFAGAMVELALLGLARVYWTVFSGIDGFGAGGALGHVLLAFGVLGAVAGAVMCVLQHHLKRMIAFSTVSHSGLFLVGLATLDGHGLGGVLVFMLAHGLVDAALFMATGIVGRRLGTVSERHLHGRGRPLWAAGPAFALAALAIASLPPFGPFAGKALVEEAATARGWWWVPAVFALCTALTGGALLRAAGRVFLGLGAPAPHDAAAGEREAADEHDGAGWGRTPARMLAPMLALLLAGLAVGLAPGLRHGADRAAAAFADRPAYAALVLHARGADRPHGEPAGGPHTASYLWAAGSVVGALATAGAALWPRRRPVPALAARPVAVLRAWHSGHLGDYATWAAVGVVVLGWSLAAGVR